VARLLARPGIGGGTAVNGLIGKRVTRQFSLQQGNVRAPAWRVAKQAKAVRSSKRAS
jgi:hypothetical protein